MAVKGRGAKQKGSRLERRVAEELRRSGLDPKASRMPLSGADSHLKGDVRTDLPYTIECKNTERVQLWKSWEQAHGQAHYNPALLFISANHRPVLAVIDMDTLMHLLQCEKQLNETLLPAGSIKGKGHKVSLRRSKWVRKVDGTVVLRKAE